MYEITFDACDFRQPLANEFPDDAAIELARVEAEQRLGRSLHADPRTGFPGFTLYRDGEEVGGG